MKIGGNEDMVAFWFEYNILILLIAKEKFYNRRRRISEIFCTGKRQQSDMKLYKDDYVILSEASIITENSTVGTSLVIDHILNIIKKNKSTYVI